MMRMLAWLLMLLLIAIVACGIMYVPQHDGRLTDLLALVLLPTAGICWCIAQLLPMPRHGNKSHSQKNADETQP